MQDFGFIIMRHINNYDTSLYWRECINCIRKYYDNLIIVIDDNSTIISNIHTDQTLFTNIQIYTSEIPGAGEIYAYYFAYKYKPFKHFVVLHDSMFLQRHLPITQIQTVKFLWHFDTHLGTDDTEKHTDPNIYFINMCNNIPYITNLYYNKRKWHGCFGVSSIINIHFLSKLFIQFNFENVINNVNCRQHREAMERVFALLCFLLDNKLFYNPSLFGNILTNYRFSYSVNWHHYLKGYRDHCTINKVWSGR
jgi:hypothetical protein